ncbi:hypothetical protein [Candidatus Mycobacterium wuenschmannii]|uniref:hypothetical protein n=1 Tax=Candidatus Mycobacterium wuenschmannii TaxID=3027808 RepID=UPI0036F3396E
MDGHVHRLAVGQRPHLIAARVAILALLAIDGVLSAVGGALLLPSYIGSFPFPISALISGLVNAALVWAAGRWTDSTRLAALPLWAWLLTVLVMCLPGPGDDVIFAGRGLFAYSPLLLLAVGLLPPVWVLMRRAPAR